MSYLADFLFAPARANSPVRSLSGGERNRLLLARLFALPANVLVLDEPTNDLDIDTLELLEELLQDFGGTVFLVSHDRRFLDNVVTQVVAAEGDGRWREYVGGYSDWVRQRPTCPAPAAGLPATREPPPASTAAPTRDSGRTGPVKLSYKEARELEQLPARIEALENEQRALAELMSRGDYHRRDAEAMRRDAARGTEIERGLEPAFERLLLWFPKVWRSIPALFVMSLFVNLGMWFERFVIIVVSLSHEYEPFAMGHYTPSWVDWTILAGSFAWFFMWFLLFAKNIPTVSITEVKEIIPMPRRKGAHA